jgi:uncharacterized membrane protein (UPF0127 family)
MNRRFRFTNKSKSTVLATNAGVADNFFTRARGLLFTKPLEKGEGLWLKPCDSIHMIGMTYAIDVLFIDKQGKVIGCVHKIKPWRMSRMYSRAQGCLELPPGTISDTGTELGDEIEWSEISS